MQLKFALPNTQRLPHIKFVLEKAIEAQLERMNEKAPPVTDNEEDYNEEKNLSFRFGEYESRQGK